MRNLQSAVGLGKLTPRNEEHCYIYNYNFLKVKLNRHASACASPTAMVKVNGHVYHAPRISFFFEFNLSMLVDALL